MNDLAAFGKQFEFSQHYWLEPQKLGIIDLYQIGELCCESGFKIDTHVQVCNEISYIVSGEGIFTTDNVETHVYPGQIYMNSKNHTHSIEADKNMPLRYYYIAFEFNEDAVGYEPLINFFKELHQPVIDDKFDIMVYFSKIMDELYNKTTFYSDVMESLIKTIIIHTYRSYKQQKLIRLPNKSTKIVGYTIYSVIMYVNEHIYDIHDVRSISDNLGYSYSYLSHLFRDKMGMTLQNYINIKKIEKAIELMKCQRINITQVAEKLNYEAVQSFSKSFKRTIGMSPIEYQKQYILNA